MFKLLLLAAVFVIAYKAHAQSPQHLNLKTCIDLKTENSYRLQPGSYIIKASEYMVSAIKARQLPMVSGELASEHRILKPYSFNQAWASVNVGWSLGDYIKKTEQGGLQYVENHRLRR